MFPLPNPLGPILYRRGLRESQYQQQHQKSLHQHKIYQLQNHQRQAQHNRQQLQQQQQQLSYPLHRLKDLHPQHHEHQLQQQNQCLKQNLLTPGITAQSTSTGILFKSHHRVPS